MFALLLRKILDNGKWEDKAIYVCESERRAMKRGERYARQIGCQIQDWRVMNKECDLIVKIYTESEETGELLFKGYLSIIRLKWPRTDLEIEHGSYLETISRMGTM